MHPGFHGDGYCHDENNNEDCFYDGGDCCTTDISAVNVIYCTECKCLEPETTTISTPTTIIETTTTIDLEPCYNVNWIDDGYCDDLTNTQNCNYDGGDCCGSNVNTQYCTECQCINGGNGGESTTSIITTNDLGVCSNIGWVGDGYCDDSTNNPECNYDGGDCCGYNVNTQFCTFCQCINGGYGGGSTTWW